MTDKTQAETLPETDPQTQGETQAQTDPEAMCGDCGTFGVDDSHTCPEPPKTYDTFLISTRTPYTPPRLDCCTHATISVLTDPDGRGPGDILIEHRHSTTCDVWRYVP